MRANKIEKFLIEKGLRYEKNYQSIDIYGYRGKYKVNIDWQFGTYIVAKYLDYSYICEVDCRNQDRVISLLDY